MGCVAALASERAKDLNSQELHANEERECARTGVVGEKITFGQQAAAMN